jgi:uncharacterized OsmC-like protein
MKAIIESAGNVASRARLGDHELVFDQPRSVPGGEDRGPSPLDLMAASVAACAHYYAAAFLYARGLATEGLSVEVEFEKERLPVSRIGHLALTVHLPVGLSGRLTDRQIAGVERAIESCPAYGTLLQPPRVEISIDASPPAADRRTA